MINDFSSIDASVENFLTQATGFQNPPAGHSAMIALRELGRKRLAETPQDSQAHFDLGLLELEAFDAPADALPYFMEACRLNPPASIEWFYAGAANLRLGRFEAAIGCFRTAEDAGHRTAATAELSGDAQYNLGKFAAARCSYRRAFLRADANAEIRSKLGLAEVRSGIICEGLAQLRTAVRQNPASRALHDRLIAAEMWLGHMSEAVLAAEYEIGCIDAQPDDFLRVAGICAESKRRAHLLQVLHAGIARFPDSAALRTAVTNAEGDRGPSPFAWALELAFRKPLTTI